MTDQLHGEGGVRGGRGRFTLERIVEAHEAQESGKVTGNIVVEVGKEE